MRRLLTTLVALAVPIGLVFGWSGTAQAGPATSITCGEPVVTNVVLHEDVTCDGPVLVIGADNIVINLNGHTITTTEPATGGPTGNAIIDGEWMDRGGHSGWKIRNGTVSGGVMMGGAINAVLTHLRVTRGVSNFFGSATIRHAQIDGDVFGQKTRFMTVRDTELGSLNGHEAANLSCIRCTVHQGMYFFESDIITIKHSVIQGGIDLFICNHSSDPLSVISHNDIYGADTGIGLAQVYNVSVTHNKIHDNKYGMLLDISQWDTKISRNKFVDNGAAGIYSQGFANNASHPTVIARNVFRHNGWNPDGATDKQGHQVRDGIHLTVGDLTGFPAVVNGNKTVDNAGYGIYSVPGMAVNTGAPNRSHNDGQGCSGITCQ